MSAKPSVDSPTSICRRFAGRVAIVTGAASGIGAQTARRLVEEGASVVLVDRDATGVAERAVELTEAGATAIAVDADVTSREQVESFVALALERFGRLDVLVNNAGVLRNDLLFRMSDDDWTAALDVNLTSAFLCTRAAQAAMVEAGGGAVVNLSSRSALGYRGQVNYSAAKAGIRGLTATTALELGPFGIRANAVAPGYIATPMTDTAARREGIEPEGYRESFAKSVALGRVGYSEEIAATIAFLASDDASFVTGQTLEVNGGWI